MYIYQVNVDYLFFLVAGRNTFLNGLYLVEFYTLFFGMFYKSRPLGLMNLYFYLSHHLSICYQIINDYINDSVCITKMSLDYGTGRALYDSLLSEARLVALILRGGINPPSLNFTYRLA